MITRLGLQNHVKIIGWASNSVVQQHILASRAMVLPSFAEGLPVVIMEALALSRPVISTYVAGIPELVESGICGWLVPPGSLEALTAAMRAALQLPVEKLEHMGRVGASRVAQRHDAAIEASKLAALFRSSIEKSQNQVLNVPIFSMPVSRLPEEIPIRKHPSSLQAERTVAKQSKSPSQ
jgi:glycosyltransferase involved in cell wall biosynthesis